MINTKEKLNEIKFSEFWFHLIIPFSYNKDMFSLLGQEDYKELLPKYEKVRVDKNVFNHYGQKAFVKTEEWEPVVKGFEITCNKFRRKQLEISQNPKYRYCFRFPGKDDADACSINIGEFRLYFHASGNGFLTIEVQTSDIDALHILDLAYGLTYIADIVTDKNGHSKIFYALKKQNPLTGKFEDAENSVTIKELAERFFKGIAAAENTDITRLNVKPENGIKYCYVMAGGLITETAEKEALSLFMDAFCMHWRSGELAGKGEEARRRLSKYDGYYDHICWETSPDAMLFIGDKQKAEEDEKSRNVLNGFQGKLAGPYLLLYLYYLNIPLELKHTEEICMKIKDQPKLAQDGGYNIDELAQFIRNFSTEMERLCEEQDHENINILFREHLCGKSFDLSSPLRVLREKYLPMLSSKKNHKIFISYRRDRGAYLALLICKLLNQMGKDVFLDLESLHAGAFDEQLLGKIDECSNVIAIISEGSMERCGSEEDWVRKELAYALEKKKNIIPIFMEGVDGFPEDLPAEIEQIRNMQGIKVDIRYFDAVMEQLLSYLE